MVIILFCSGCFPLSDQPQVFRIKTHLTQGICTTWKHLTVMQHALGMLPCELPA